VELVKSHGLGNDYLVLCSGELMTPAWAIALCERHKGVGGDGVLEPFSTDKADYGVRIWNPDGSLAEKSGNGLRIFARWLVDERNAPNGFSLWTGFCLVHCDVGDDTIAVKMGVARFPSVNGEPETLQVGTDNLSVTVVDVGNPHCVLFFETPLDELPWRAWGAELETHPRFPARTNVQFARIIDRTRVEIRIWERGAGETSASGSSSCAVAAAAVLSGRLDPGEVTVIMPGGTLQVRARDGESLLLQGPVEVTAQIHVDDQWLKSRR